MEQAWKECTTKATAKVWGKAEEICHILQCFGAQISLGKDKDEPLGIKQEFVTDQR